MFVDGCVGEKRGEGFYKCVKNAGGESTILEMNLKKMEEEAEQKKRFPSIGAARSIDDPLQRMLTVLAADDRAGQLARETTADSLVYAAKITPEIAGSIVDVDEAMRWGFNFDAGSFEVWDTLLQHPDVLQKVLQARGDSGALPELVTRVKSAGQGTFYTGIPGKRAYFDFHTNVYKPVREPEGAISLAAARAANKGIRDNGSGALIDLGDR